MNIVEFLEARIDEDEEQASSGWERLGDSRWERDNYGRTLLTPAAVLAECKAKREILERISSDAVRDVTLRLIIASVYADHPDYQQEWGR